ncbi:hypothetical protein FRC17_010663 [Serendipita sp. 399]|nr:hypothetical protein FRC17_010663 [Serendipita sp. 399]
MHPMLQVFFLLQALLGCLVVRAEVVLVNRTVDDSDTNIRYSGRWNVGPRHISPLNFGGSHSLSEDINAIASFAFTGVSVYYLASLWPYSVDSYISLDGGIETLVNLTAPSGTVRPSNVSIGDEVVNYDVRWSATGLENRTHIVTINRGSAGFAIVDGFTFTVVRIEETSASESISSGGTNETSNPATTSSGGLSAKSITIISVSVSIFAILILIAFFLCLRAARRRKIARNQMLESPQGPFTIPTSVATPRTGSGITHAHSMNMEERIGSQYIATPWQGYDPTMPPVDIVDSKSRYIAHPPFQGLHSSSLSQDPAMGYNDLYSAGAPRYHAHSTSSTSFISPPSAQAGSSMFYMTPSPHIPTTAPHRANMSHQSTPSKDSSTMHQAISSQPPTTSHAKLELSTTQNVEDGHVGSPSAPPPYVSPVALGI